MQGHVDAVGHIIVPAPDLAVRMPAELLRYVVEKGSITVDGISLTVVAVLDDGFTVAVIPHTDGGDHPGATRASAIRSTSRSTSSASTPNACYSAQLDPSLLLPPPEASP